MRASWLTSRKNAAAARNAANHAPAARPRRRRPRAGSRRARRVRRARAAAAPAARRGTRPTHAAERRGRAQLASASPKSGDPRAADEPPDGRVVRLGEDGVRRASGAVAQAQVTPSSSQRECRSSPTQRSVNAASRTFKTARGGNVGGIGAGMEPPPLGRVQRRRAPIPNRAGATSVCRSGWPRRPRPCRRSRETRHAHPLARLRSRRPRRRRRSRLAADEGSDRRPALRQAEEPLRDRAGPRPPQACAALRTRSPGTEEAVEAWVLEARALLQARQAARGARRRSAFLPRTARTCGPGACDTSLPRRTRRWAIRRRPPRRCRRSPTTPRRAEARAQIGALHLKLADEDFDGVEAKDDLGRAVKRRDVPRALASYRQALEVGLAPVDALRARERVAQALEETGDFANARLVWAALAKEHDEAGEARGARARGALARGRRRARRSRAGEPDEARAAAQEGPGAVPEGALAFEALRAPRRGAPFAARRCGGRPRVRRGRHVAEPRDPRAPRRPRRRSTPSVRLAEAYEARGHSEKAAAGVERARRARPALRAPRRRWPAIGRRRPWCRPAASTRRSPSGIGSLRPIPNHPLWPEVREKIAAAGLGKAQSLLERGDTDGAVAAWQRFAEERPEDPRAPAGARSGRARAPRARRTSRARIALWRARGGPLRADARTPRQARLAIAHDRSRTTSSASRRPLRRTRRSSRSTRARAQARRRRRASSGSRRSTSRSAGSASWAAPSRPCSASSRATSRALRVRVYRLGLEEYFRRKDTVDGRRGAPARDREARPHGRVEVRGVQALSRWSRPTARCP